VSSCESHGRFGSPPGNLNLELEVKLPVGSAFCQRAQRISQQDFDDKLSQSWLKLDLMRYPISFTVDQGKRRSYALYLIISILTLGLFWIFVWDYKIQTDPNNLYDEFHSVEDTVLNTVRAH
jgi:hypothetical protein